jgi:lipid-binding SYLF domain-containing protein
MRVILEPSRLSLTSPIIGFILDQQGLMYSLSLEGSKITRITR